MTKPLFLLGIATLAAGLVLAAPADAAPRHRNRAQAPRAAHKVVPMPGSPTDPDKDAALILDGATGKVLYARNETAERHPASLTKMMTLYMLFEALKAGKITMQTPMPVSAHAAQQKPTKLSLRKGTTITVDTAIRAIVIRSANDVAVVVAEALGGTELHFAQMMTEKARALGMRETYYHNASGLPDPLQITTATDLSVLARHLAYDFPQFYPYFALPGFNYKGVYYPTHDNLIGRYPGADGIKTGFTVASGFNLTSSVVRGGVHLIGIVMGGRTAVRRDMEMMRLLDTAFAQIESNPTLVARGPVPWTAVADLGKQPAVAGFTLPAPAAAPPATQFVALSAVPAIPATDDEDAAESRRAPDENFSTLHSQAPQLETVAQPPRPAPVSAIPPSVAQAASASVLKPGAHEAGLESSAAAVPQARPQQAGDAKPVVVAALPKMRPVLRNDASDNDLDLAGMAAAGRNWTIQIGAYADQAFARAQLDAYAQKSMDVLGQAARLVVPFQSSDGHTMYRARFGLFAERKAREVCDRLTQRGQTCFAAIAAR
ncbi:MAG: SPOR domain-containing protein [Alphaproteobacteria bacterium]|nr:SPOR domain-containing protein [Alphaproteobacteria bacterium]